MPSRFEVAKTRENAYEVRLGTPGWEEGGPSFHYKLTVEAEDIENIKMSSGEWSNRKTKDGKVVFTGAAYGFPADALRAINPKSVRCEVLKGSEVPSFNATYIDETAKEPKRETLATMQKDYTWYVSPWANPMVRNSAIGLGIIGAGLAVTKALEWW